MVESDDHAVAKLYSSWLRPRDALAWLPNEWALESKIRWIAERLRGNLIRAAAKAYHRDGNSVAEQAYVLIPATSWKSWPCLADRDFWAGGDVTFSSTANLRGITFFSVRLDPEGFAEYGPPPQEPPPNPVEIIRQDAFAPKRNVGGRPPKPFWEPLLIEMARQLYCGDLHPTRQADIENAMHDWLTANGHKGGETQVRQRAKSLWEAIQK